MREKETTKEEIMKQAERDLRIPLQKAKDKSLVFFFGLPGSGKSMLAGIIKNLIPCVYISGDRIALSHDLDKTDNYHWTFEIMNSLAEKYLKEGYNVVLDSNSDKYRIRKELYGMAAECGAEAYCFWVKTDIKTISERQMKRNEKKRSLRKEHLFYVGPKDIEKFIRELEPPREEENVIIIDGEEDFVPQLRYLKESIGLIGRNFYI